MTDATVELKGESKRPQAADSSSSSESSTDTEMGLVDVCTILRDNSEAGKRERVVTVKPVAVAEERERGLVRERAAGKPVVVPNQMEKIERNFETVVAYGITDRF